MAYTVIIAGLPTPAFDRIKKISANRLAPDGVLILSPTPRGYTHQYTDDIIRKAHNHAMALREGEPLSIQLLYVDYRDDATKAFLEAFYPFCLPIPLRPIAIDSQDTKKMREALNGFVDEVLQGTRELRNRARMLSGFTHIANLTPLLLPPKNFRSRHLDGLLRTLFHQAGTVSDLRLLIEAEIRAFLARCPRVKAPEDDRHSLSDGYLYFRSPGNNRHGYYRRDDRSHPLTCLLNARSRIGGTYQHNFHYDCIPSKGSLRGSYDNCHGEPTATKPSHVNIAPNDYIG